MASIFIKKTDNKKNWLINSSEEKIMESDILNNIPKSACKKENPELRKTKIEWRWRIFKIPFNNTIKKVVEISFIKPNEKRLLVNKYGDWVLDEIDPLYNDYVCEEYYYYY